MCGFTSKKSLFPPGGPHCSFSPPNILLCSASTPPGASRRAVVAWLYERGARKQFYGFSVNFTGAVGAGAGAPTPRQKRNLRIFFRAPLSLQCHRRPFDPPCAVWAPHRASNTGVRWALENFCTKVVGIQGDNSTRVAYNGINYEERRTSR